MANRKLCQLDAATTLDTLRVPRGNRAEPTTCSSWAGTGEDDGRETLPTIHPGEVPAADFIQGFGITRNKLAVSVGVPPASNQRDRVNEIVRGKRGTTADTALRLARYLGASEEFWMNLQSNYELRLKRRTLRDTVAAVTPLKDA